MILNSERSPKDSLYYIGAFLLKILKNEKNEIEINELLRKAKEQNINISLFYYALDWLYLISLIEVKEERIYLK